MERIVLVCLLAVSSAVVSLAEDKMMNAAGTYVKLDEMKGNLAASKNDSIDSDNNKVMVTVTGLKQKLSNDTVVDSNIASVNVTFTDEADATIDTLDVKHIMSTAATDMGTFSTDVMILKEDGNLTTGDEVIVGMAGNIRLKMSAAGLSLEEGSTLQVEVMIKGKADAPTADGMMYTLGGGAKAQLSGKVYVDDTEQALADNAITMSGSTFTFMFPRGTTLDYNVFLMLGAADIPSGGDTGSASGVTSLGIMTLLAIALLKFIF